MQPNEKVCTYCETLKPIAEFARAKQAPGGVRSFCKACHNARMKAWRDKNPEKVRASVKRYEQENPEKVAARKRAYLAANVEKVAAGQRAWRAVNKERKAAQVRAWRQANAERCREYRHKRRAMERAAGWEVVDLDGLWTGACGICDEPMERNAHKWPHPESSSIDHIIPIVRGGGHLTANLQWAHLSCNLRKGDREQERGA